MSISDFSAKGLLDKHIVPWKGKSFKVPTLEEIREAEKKRLVTVLLVFGDESHEGAEKRVYAVAGLIGTKQDWDDLMVRWIERTKGKPFHAVDCESDQGDYKDNPHCENQELYRDLVNMLAQSKIKGFGQAMDIRGWKEFFPGRGKTMPYMHCFEFVVNYFAKIGSKSKCKIDFIFDHNLEVSHNASYLFHEMAKSNEWKYPEWLGGIEYKIKKDNIELQVACMWARECMKHVDNPPDVDTRKSMQVLLDTDRFQCHLMDRKYWEDFRRDVDEAKYDEYKKWLDRKKRKDNLTNKIEYIFRSK